MKTHFTISLLLVQFFFSLLGGDETRNVQQMQDDNFLEKREGDRKVQNCFDEETKSDLLNNKIKDYFVQSFRSGIGFTKTTDDIRKLYYAGKLHFISSCSYYVVDTMFFSYSFLVPEAKNLLNCIGKEFQKKLRLTDLGTTKFHVTSALRTTTTVKRLRRRNRNASRFSAHLHGTAFDIGYDDFVSLKPLSLAEKDALKDVLAVVLLDLKMKNLCWVTYETNQSCFHVVWRDQVFD